MTADDDSLLGAARAMMAISQLAAGALPERVSMVQLRALAALAGRPSTNLAEFAETLGLSASAASRLLDRLVAAGYASRSASPRTRREIALDLTPGGRDLLAAYDRHRLAALTDILDRLPESRRAAVIAALGEIAAATSPGEDHVQR